MQQNKWMCNGIVEDGQQHPNQELQGIYKPYDNYGNDCVICHLAQEQVVGDASKSSCLLYPQPSPQFLHQHHRKYLRQ